ncbi:MAG: hypothetical protein U1F66_10620 [bacterium]
MRPLRHFFKILPALALLATAFLAGCEKKSPPPSPPFPTAAPASTKSLGLPRFMGLSLNGQPIEQVAAATQDPQSLDVPDLQKTFGIQDPAYLERVLQLIESQLQSGSPMKWIGVYFGGAPKILAPRCVKDLAAGVCLIEPYAFNCGEAISQKNWNEENYLKLCRRLGRLKAYKADRLIALVSGDASLAYRETLAVSPPAPTAKPPEKKASKAKAAPAATPAPSAAESPKAGGWQVFPEMADLLQYLQREGIMVGFLSDQEGAAALSMLQSLGINLPAERIAGRDAASAPGDPESRVLQALRLARRYVEARNRLAAKPEDQINLEDLRLVLVAGDDFAPSKGAGVGDGVAYLENLSTVPGGADLLFIHRHNLEADQRLTRKKSALENFQFFVAQERQIHPLRIGIFLEQAAIGEVRSPGGKGGFLTQNPAAAPETLPSESQPTESKPSAVESRPSATPVPGAVKSPESKPSPLLQLPPAPPPDPRKDAL